MKAPSPIRSATLLMLIAVGACADGAPVAPSAAAVPSASTTTASSNSDEVSAISPVVADLDARLAAAGSRLRVAKAEMIRSADSSFDAASSTLIFANDRVRGLAGEWVAGDPRRDGRVGVTYAIRPDQAQLPLTRNPDGTNLHFVPFTQLEAQIEEGVAAWRDLTCSNAPITRAAVAPGTDADIVDELIAGLPPKANYAQPADIVESGWMPSAFFRAIDPVNGNNIIGVTFSLYFTDALGQFTDIDRDGKLDLGLKEIYYNTAFAWGNTGALNVVDFFSIITHETGHALGLAHFGKLFVTKHAASDGIALSDIKYAPKAMMNAAYVTGRSEIAGTDNSSFCQIWASK